MGSMTYDGLVITVEDRVLAHLQIVIVNKLRKEEGFLMSWKEAVLAGSGRGSIWLDSTIPIQFKFDGSRVPEINQVWLDQLAKSADSSKGLVVTAEAGDLVAVNDGKSSKRVKPSIVEPVAQDSGLSATEDGIASSV